MMNGEQKLRKSSSMKFGTFEDADAARKELLTGLEALALPKGAVVKVRKRSRSSFDVVVYEPIERKGEEAPAA